MLALIWRPLVLECVDPGYLRSVSRAGGPAHIAFLALVVMNLVGGFQALGTLLAVGIMMLPAIIARFWARDITTMIAVAVGAAALSGYAGLLVSYHANLPSGPAIILAAGRALCGLGCCSDRLAGSSGSLCRAGTSKRNRRAEDQMSGWKTRRVLLVAGLAAALVAVPAAAQDSDQDQAPSRRISILGDLVKNVGGDRVDVVTLVGPDGDAHVYSPTPGDARKLAAAKIVFVNGLGLEGWMTRLVEASGTRSPIVTVSNGITRARWRTKSEPGRLVIDPHAWQSVANAKIYVANIRDGLAAIDPAGKRSTTPMRRPISASSTSWKSEVRDGDRRHSRPTAARSSPPTIRFGYFGDAYGVKFIAPERVSTDSEASARDVAKIIAQIRREKIPAVFMENITDPRLMREIARETGAAIGGTLYSDALSAPGGPAATYIEMMRHNVRELIKALVG